MRNIEALTFATRPPPRPTGRAGAVVTDWRTVLRDAQATANAEGVTLENALLAALVSELRKLD